MNELLAHSATENAPAQSYRNHVINVVARARCYLRKILLYARGWPRDRVLSALTAAATVHDFGKLDDANQQVLRGEKRASHLPINHVDAGVAYLLSKGLYFSAVLVKAHHEGLRNCMDLREESDFRDARFMDMVDGRLRAYVEQHVKECGSLAIGQIDAPPDFTPMDWRLIFACLTHADHGDTAEARGGHSGVYERMPRLRPRERLASLIKCVESLPSGKGDEIRQELRRCFFNASCASTVCGSMSLCDAPVGSGKTTAVMAYLLHQAVERKLRRIFVILPYTSIITQSAAVYRKALTLDGEDACDVVAEIHHRADFESLEARQLTALWDAPVIVTTAVAFFETLASNRPSTLRRLQNLPGSAIFLDEAHAMLPVRLLPLVWRWMCHLSDVGMCYWVLASGSLAQFWKFPEFVKHVGERQVINVIDGEVSDKLKAFERRRVNYLYKGNEETVEKLIDWIVGLEGPVIVVLNTVHTAAVVAKALVDKFGTADVYHISTALTALDREKTLKKVQARLSANKGDSRWCLVATSCVEAGMDFSFRTGVREMASLASLVQLAGRVNRNSEYEMADVWSFGFSFEENRVKINPGVATSARLLDDYFKKGEPITPELCTQAMRRELVQAHVCSVKTAEDLLVKESQFAFKAVAELFHVIDDSTELVVVDPCLIERIEKFEAVDWRQIQDGSVRIRRKILDRVAAVPSVRYPEVWLWKYPYSSFLGYMEYLLQLEQIDSDSFSIV